MNQIPDRCLSSSAPAFTPKQGQYLAFIHAYTLVLGSKAGACLHPVMG